jgi:outer membrane PBP1 activator LpoA protein
MTVPLKLTIPNRITFNRGLISGVFILATGEPVNLIRPIIAKQDNHTDPTSDKGKDYF